MFDPELRIVIGKVIRKPLRKTPIWLTPNLTTSFGLIIGLSVPIVVILELPILALLLFLLNRIVDAFDGGIAREKDSESVFGEIFDLASDFLVYALIPISIAYQYGDQNAMIVTALLLGSYYVNVGILLSVSRIPDNRSRGLIEGFETIVFYCVMIVATEYFNQLASVFTLLVFITAIQRLFKLYSNSFNR